MLKTRPKSMVRHQLAQVKSGRSHKMDNEKGEPSVRSAIGNTIRDNLEEAKGGCGYVIDIGVTADKILALLKGRFEGVVIYKECPVCKGTGTSIVLKHPGPCPICATKGRIPTTFDEIVGESR